MGEIGAGNNSSYPGALDTNSIPEVNSPAAGKTKARKEVVEDLTAAVIAIETELGTDPAGSLTDVKTFLQTHHQTDGTHKNTHGPHKWLDEQDYANFTAAVAAASNKTLVVSRSINLDANTVIGASVSLMPLNPGIINANGYTLTINGPVVGNPMHQWLSGFAAGEVIFGPGSVQFVLAEWFYSGTGLWTLAIQSALDCFNPIIGGEVKSLARTYTTADLTINNRGVRWTGVGNGDYNITGGDKQESTIILYDGTTTGKLLTLAPSLHWGNISKMTLVNKNSGTTNTDYGIFVAGGAGLGIHQFKFKELTLGGFAVAMQLRTSHLNFINDCQFGTYEHNNDYRNGIGINIVNASHAIMIENSHFANNDVGAIVGQSREVNFSNCIFERHNSVATRGYDVANVHSNKSAISVLDASTVNVSECYFEKNDASIWAGDRRGGGNITDSKVFIEKSHFTAPAEPGGSAGTHIYEGDCELLSFGAGNDFDTSNGETIWDKVNQVSDKVQVGVLDADNMLVGGQRIQRVNAYGMSGFNFKNQLDDDFIPVKARLVDLGSSSTTTIVGVGVTNDEYLQIKSNNIARALGLATAAPTTGTWTQGDIILNSNPTAGGTIGWCCTTSGTPGTWKAFGTIAS